LIPRARETLSPGTAPPRRLQCGKTFPPGKETHGMPSLYAGTLTSGLIIMTGIAWQRGWRLKAVLPFFIYLFLTTALQSLGAELLPRLPLSLEARCTICDLAAWGAAFACLIHMIAKPPPARGKKKADSRIPSALPIPPAGEQPSQTPPTRPPPLNERRAEGSDQNAIKFFCVRCGQHLEAESDMAGATLQCPVCQQTITVPPSPSASSREKCAGAGG